MLLALIQHFTLQTAAETSSVNKIHLNMIATLMSNKIIITLYSTNRWGVTVIHLKRPTLFPQNLTNSVLPFSMHCSKPTGSLDVLFSILKVRTKIYINLEYQHKFWFFIDTDIYSITLQPQSTFSIKKLIYFFSKLWGLCIWRTIALWKRIFMQN